MPPSRCLLVLLHTVLPLLLLMCTPYRVQCQVNSRVTDNDYMGKKLDSSDVLHAFIRNQVVEDVSITPTLNIVPVSTRTNVNADELCVVGVDTTITAQDSDVLFMTSVSVGSYMSAALVRSSTATTAAQTTTNNKKYVYLSATYKVKYDTTSKRCVSERSGDPLIVTQKLQTVTDFISFGISRDDTSAIVLSDTAYFIISYNLFPFFSLRQSLTFTSPFSNLASNQLFTPRNMYVIEDSYFVVVGWKDGGSSAEPQFTPILYLAQWGKSGTSITQLGSYSPTLNDWQSEYILDDINNQYEPMYQMHVSARKDGRIAWSIPVYNMVILLNVNRDGSGLINGLTTDTSSSSAPQTRIDGEGAGWGKSVSWMGKILMVLANNVKPIDFTNIVPVQASTVEFYDVDTASFNDDANPTFVFPNYAQKLVSNFVSPFIQILGVNSASITNGIFYTLYTNGLDGGDVFSIPQSAAGYYTLTTAVPEPTSVPCMAGTYKSEVSVFPCQLCPSGSYNPGSSDGTTIPATNLVCQNCSSESFCPLGAIYEQDWGTLNRLTQTFTYPHSPQALDFEDILFEYMIRIPKDCVADSAIFWALMIAVVGISLYAVIAFWQYCAKSEGSKHKAKVAKAFLLRMDVVLEGESYVGGIASLCMLVLWAAGMFLTVKLDQEYPYETAPFFKFTCMKLQNSKFEQVQLPIALKPPKFQEVILDFLSTQELNMTVEFHQTTAVCRDLTIYLVKSTRTKVKPLQCYDALSSRNPFPGISVQIKLVSHKANYQYVLKNKQLVGALKLGMDGQGFYYWMPNPKGPKYGSGDMTFRDVLFSHPFTSMKQTLDRTATLNVELVSAVNLTLPYVHYTTEYFRAILLPQFDQSELEDDGLFQSNSEFMAKQDSQLTLNVNVKPSLSWMSFQQAPIANTNELIFKMILFTILLIELFALGFLVFHLLHPFWKCFKNAVTGKKIFSVDELVAELSESDSDDEHEGGGHGHHAHGSHAKHGHGVDQHHDKEHGAHDTHDTHEKAHGHGETHDDPHKPLNGSQMHHRPTASQSSNGPSSPHSGQGPVRLHNMSGGSGDQHNGGADTSNIHVHVPPSHNGAPPNNMYGQNAPPRQSMEMAPMNGGQGGGGMRPSMGMGQPRNSQSPPGPNGQRFMSSAPMARSPQHSTVNPRFNPNQGQNIRI